jgi:hypothetical protein
MSLTEELPIYKASYDMVLVIFQLVKNFNKEYKYTIGESIKNETIKLITNIYRANCSRNKIEYLNTARENLEVIRLYIRLTKNLHQISVKQLAYVSLHIENISKQLAGWYKSQNKVTNERKTEQQ